MVFLPGRRVQLINTRTTTRILCLQQDKDESVLPLGPISEDDFADFHLFSGTRNSFAC